MKIIYTTIIAFSLLVSLSSQAKNIDDKPSSVSIQELSVKFDADKNVNILFWETLNSSEIKYFIVESTSNGSDFKVIGYVFTGEINNYRFKASNDNSMQYRIQAVLNNDKVACTASVKIQTISTCPSNL